MKKSVLECRIKIKHSVKCVCVTPYGNQCLVGFKGFRSIGMKTIALLGIKVKI